MQSADTKQKILQVAEELTKQRGFDGFSYRDISQEVGVKTSSIHYHFPTKGDLSEELIERYTEGFSTALSAIHETKADGYGKIKSLLQIFISALGENQNLCLCGMLSANASTLTPRGKKLLDTFFCQMEKWLETVIEEGIADGSIHKSIRARSSAMEIIALAEGAMLLARVREQGNYFADLLDLQLARLRG